MSVLHFDVLFGNLYLGTESTDNTSKSNDSDASVALGSLEIRAPPNTPIISAEEPDAPEFGTTEMRDVFNAEHANMNTIQSDHMKDGIHMDGSMAIIIGICFISVCMMMIFMLLIFHKKYKTTKYEKNKTSSDRHPSISNINVSDLNLSTSTLCSIGEDLV